MFDDQNSDIWNQRISDLSGRFEAADPARQAVGEMSGSKNSDRGTVAAQIKACCLTCPTGKSALSLNLYGKWITTWRNTAQIKGRLFQIAQNFWLDSLINNEA